MRLGVSGYGYWNEALHGVARSGLATSFPQAIALASTWDTDLMYEVASAISDEARVYYNLKGKGLSYWSPTINVSRDPRWGRAEEAYSEDPFLTAQFGISFVKGMQGENPDYLKTIATIKHFAANNSEYNRRHGSSDMDERTLREYYLPAFKATVEEANPFSLMTAYNAINGIPASAHKELVTDILRDQWGFLDMLFLIMAQFPMFILAIIMLQQHQKQPLFASKREPISMPVIFIKIILLRRLKKVT